MQQQTTCSFGIHCSELNSLYSVFHPGVLQSPRWHPAAGVTYTMSEWKNPAFRSCKIPPDNVIMISTFYLHLDYYHKLSVYQNGISSRYLLRDIHYNSARDVIGVVEGQQLYLKLSADRMFFHLAGEPEVGYRLLFTYHKVRVIFVWIDHCIVCIND